MGEPVLVQAGGAQFYVEVVEAADGVGPVALDDVVSFDGVRDTICGIAEVLAEAWDRVKPTEAKVEFGLKVTTKTGKLTGLLVEGGGEASLSVSLTWSRPPSAG